MKPLRVAVIGAGHLGRIHARLLKQVDGAELVGIADPVEAARLQASSDCGVPAYADFRALVGHVDAAVVATPTVHHFAVGKELLDAGIPLLIEKPIAPTVAEANELVEIARRRNIVLQVGHIERFNPAFAAVAAELSRPKYIEASRLSGFTFRSTDIGVVLDLMIHDIDIVLALARSEVRSVDALGISLMGGHEDIAQARLTFANGCVANLTASRVSYRSERVMQLWSEQGFANIDFSTRCSTFVRPTSQIASGHFDAQAVPAEERLRLKDRLFEELLPMTQTQPDATNALLDELVDFVTSVRESRAPRVTGEQGRDALAIAESILGQIERHAWNGEFEGPVGPHLRPSHSILRGPHWASAAVPAQPRWHKEAS